MTIRTSPEVDTHIEGAQIHQPVSIVRAELHDAIRRLGLVGVDRASVGAARRIVDDFLEGAGVGGDEDDVEWSSKRKDEALSGIERFLDKRARQQQTPVLKKEFRPVKLTRRTEELDPNTVLDGHSDPFKRGAAMNHWKRSVTGITRFDAETTEFELAHLMERDPKIRFWRRLEVSDGVWLVRETSGKYSPDFIALDNDGVYWLIEAKADGKDNDADVQAKRQTAEDWARRVRDECEFGVWKHLYCTETHIKESNRSWDSLLLRADPVG